MKQELFDMVSLFWAFLSLSLIEIDFIGVEGLALEGRFGKTLSTQTMTLLWAGEVGQDSLGYGLTFGLPLHVFVVCCWGGRVFPKAAWRKNSLTLFSLLQLSSLSPIDFIWVEGLALQGGPARFPQLWSYYSSFMFLSVVARVEGLSHKDHDATSFWHCVHSFGCLSLFCKLDATTVHEINPKRNPQMDAPKLCKRTPNTWLWGTPI